MSCNHTFKNNFDIPSLPSWYIRAVSNFTRISSLNPFPSASLLVHLQRCSDFFLDRLFCLLGACIVSTSVLCLILCSRPSYLLQLPCIQGIAINIPILKYCKILNLEKNYNSKGVFLQSQHNSTSNKRLKELEHQESPGGKDGIVKKSLLQLFSCH